MATMFRPPVQIHRLDVRLPRAKELNARPGNSKTVIPTLCRRVIFADWGGLGVKGN
jgi:hypothetical protein